MVTAKRHHENILVFLAMMKVRPAALNSLAGSMKP